MIQQWFRIVAVFLSWQNWIFPLVVWLSSHSCLINMFKYRTSINQLLCHLSVRPNRETHPDFPTFSMSLNLTIAIFISLPHSVTHTCTNTLPFFHLLLGPWRCFPPWSKVGLYHGHLTRLPETTKKGRVLIGITDRWKTGGVEIRDQCDANKACIQWLQSLLRVHCFFLLCN